jgi:outer membrane lipoprotein-sorting protein
VRSMYCEFRQFRHMDILGEPIESRGVIAFEQPKSIRWETVSPYRSLIVYDGRSPAQFEWRDGKRVRLQVPFGGAFGRIIGHIVAIHRGDFDSLSSDYDISASRGAEGVSMTLIPKDQRARQALSAIEMRLSKDLSVVKEVILKEPGGDFTRISFENERRNVTFPKGTFDLGNPADLEDVRAAATAGERKGD